MLPTGSYMHAIFASPVDVLAYWPGSKGVITST